MRWIRLLGPTLLAVMASSAIVASVAQATSAPYWAINGTRLAEGKTHFIQAKATTTLEFDIAAAGIIMKCTALKLKEGVLLGSSESNPGTDDEVVVFTGCSVTGNGSSCAVEGGTITTNALKSELVEAPNGKQLLTEFFPAKGAALVTIKFTGICTVTSTAVTGQLAAEGLGVNEEVLELGQAPKQGAFGYIKFPATPIRKVILVKAGVAKEEILEELTFFSDPAALLATVLVALTSSNGGAIETGGPYWSALP